MEMDATQIVKLRLDLSVVMQKRERKMSALKCAETA
jgi:hypothetical protein